MIGWVSQNSQSVRNRAVSLCLYNMSVQVGSVLATRIYTAGEKPYYAKGNLALISLACLSIVLCWLAKLYTLDATSRRSRPGTPSAQTSSCSTNSTQKMKARSAWMSCSFTERFEPLSFGASPYECSSTPSTVHGWQLGNGKDGSSFPYLVYRIADSNNRCINSLFDEVIRNEVVCDSAEAESAKIFRMCMPAAL